MCDVSCISCKYSYSNNDCDKKIKYGCKDCPMNIDDNTCKCATHAKYGENCPDFELAEDCK